MLCKPLIQFDNEEHTNVTALTIFTLYVARFAYSSTGMLRMGVVAVISNKVSHKTSHNPREGRQKNEKYHCMNFI